MNSYTAIGILAVSAKSTSQSSASSSASSLMPVTLTFASTPRTIRQQCSLVGTCRLHMQGPGLRYQHLPTHPSCNSARIHEPPSRRCVSATPAEWKNFVSKKNVFRQHWTRSSTFDRRIFCVCGDQTFGVYKDAHKSQWNVKREWHGQGQYYFMVLWQRISDWWAELIFKWCNVLINNKRNIFLCGVEHKNSPLNMTE